MKRRLLTIGIIAIGGFVLVANASIGNKDLTSILTMENVEALADLNESGGDSRIECWETVSDSGDKLQTHYTYCGTCDPLLGRETMTKKTCPKK